MSKDAAADSEEHYEKTTAFVWTERAFEFLQTGTLHAEIRQPRPGVHVAHVWGQCPRCGHHIDDWQPLSAVTGLAGSRGSASAARKPTNVEPIDIGCGCGITHSGAPVETTGCGVSFRIELEPVPDSGTAARGS